MFKSVLKIPKFVKDSLKERKNAFSGIFTKNSKVLGDRVSACGFSDIAFRLGNNQITTDNNVVYKVFRLSSTTTMQVDKISNRNSAIDNKTDKIYLYNRYK